MSHELVYMPIMYYNPSKGLGEVFGMADFSGDMCPGNRTISFPNLDSKVWNIDMMWVFSWYFGIDYFYSRVVVFIDLCRLYLGKSDWF